MRSKKAAHDSKASGNLFQHLKPGLWGRSKMFGYADDGNDINTNIEILNSKQYQMIKIQMIKTDPSIGFRSTFGSLAHWVFEFVLDFDIRILNFHDSMRSNTHPQGEISVGLYGPGYLLIVKIALGSLSPP
jgi:hypothetical protein